MNFNEIARNRQSCRSYNPERNVEEEKIFAVLESARLSPSACNGQPYHITVCKGEAAKKIAPCVQGMGMNRFASDVPVFLVISEKPYVKTAAVGSKLKHNDYRSIDIGILSAYITAEAASQGLGSCILGWFDSEKIESLCSLDGTVRLVITLGYPKDGEVLREKKRKTIDELVSFVD
ncbi:MAG: nitroreductase family protein [Clostridia bacterium]|nr:nitroreductase family protein [Clostridia bacterium]